MIRKSPQVQAGGRGKRSMGGGGEIPKTPRATTNRVGEEGGIQTGRRGENLGMPEQGFTFLNWHRRHRTSQIIENSSRFEEIKEKREFEEGGEVTYIKGGR